MAGGKAGAAHGGGHIVSLPTTMTYVSIGVVMMGAAMFGADQNNYGLTYGLRSFQEHWCPTFNFDSSEVSDCSTIADMEHPPAAWESFITWGLNLVTFGMMCGALVPGPILASYLGRRLTTSLGGLTCFLGCVVVAWLSGGNKAVYYFGRFLTGFGCGIACYVLPMYNAEVATLNIRGLTGSLFQFMVVVGGVVAVICFGIPGIDWRQGFLVPGYLGLFVGIGALACPESPRFLIDRYSKEEGRPALQRVRSHLSDIDGELEYIDECLREERVAGQVSYLELFTKPGLRFRLFVACYLQAAQQMTGVNAFLGFQTDIFHAAGYRSDEVGKFPGGPAMITQWVFIVGSVTGLLLVDSKYGGRKRQLLGASAFMGPPLLIAAVLHFVNGPPIVTGYMVWIFAFGFQAAWGIVPWFYPAELFQMNERERALSISTFCGFLFNLLVGLITQSLFHWSQGGMFLIYGLLNITNCIFVAACMRETKGVPLEEIPALFGPVDTHSKKGKTGDENTPVEEITV